MKQKTKSATPPARKFRPTTKTPSRSKINLPKPIRRSTSRNKSKSKKKKANLIGDEWYTPAHVVALVRRALGGPITLDPASCLAANTVVGAEAFYDKEHSGLERPWYGDVYINPPFSRGMMAPFVTKLLNEWDRRILQNAPTQIIALTNNGTETDWWQSLIRQCDAVCFLDVRINFWNTIDPTKDGNRYAQTIFYFGSNASRFRDTFSPWGFVVMLDQSAQTTVFIPIADSADDLILPKS